MKNLFLAKVKTNEVSGKEWEILIPAYDIDVITELTEHYPTI